MESKSIAKIVKHLTAVQSQLSEINETDSIIRSRYAEYFTASKLAERGYTVELLHKRKVKSSDLYLPDLKKRIEVKSGNGSASFGDGAQIRKRKFDYCVFYPVGDEGRLESPLIFSIDELKELKYKRPHVGLHESN